MSLPIVFLHAGASEYLPLSIDQARRTNPASRVILIGDESNKNFTAAEHFMLREFWDEAHSFSGVYEHMNPNRYASELFCFQRWFVLNRFLAALQIPACFHSDSDVLLFADVSALQEFYGDRPIAVNRGQSPHSSYINDAAVLQSFTDFIWDHYRSPAGKAALKHRLQTVIVRGGICDMTLFELFLEKHPELVGDTYEVRGGGFFDHNVRMSDGYEVGRHNFKRIYWRQGLPHAREIESGQLLRMYAIHFCGASKSHLKSIYYRKKLSIPHLVHEAGLMRSRFRRLGRLIFKSRR